MQILHDLPSLPTNAVYELAGGPPAPGRVRGDSGCHLRLRRHQHHRPPRSATTAGRVRHQHAERCLQTHDIAGMELVSK